MLTHMLTYADVCGQALTVMLGYCESSLNADVC